MTDNLQEGVPLSHALGNGTVGQPQPQRARPTLKALAARVLEGVREPVPLSHAIRTGTVGQAVTSPASSESERAGESVPLSQTLGTGTVGQVTANLGVRGREAWDAADWQAYFDERAGIVEYDGELSRAGAERQALADTINHWLVTHPPEPTDDNDDCVHCRQPLGPDGVPVLAGTAHTLLHSACHSPWLTERRRHAAEALRAMGIEAAEVLE